jgi:hypothetical protein
MHWDAEALLELTAHAKLVLPLTLPRSAALAVDASASASAELCDESSATEDGRYLLAAEAAGLDASLADRALTPLRQSQVTA